ncbi:MAG: glycosyltransferase [Candidatus Omnitrophica bacterium]|nr:glycosyltransferase [Candidatus Omnitrophota bacterium]
MRVIVVDPFLSDLSGHNFFYNTALCAELKKRNIPFVIFGNKDSRLRIDGFYPALESITDKFFLAGNPLASLIRLTRAIRSSNAKLQRSFFDNPGFALQEGDVVFCHTLYVFEFFSFACFLRRHRRSFVAKDCTFRIGLHFRYVRSSRTATFVLGMLYRVITKFMLAPLAGSVIYHSDGRMLIPEFERLLGKKITLSSMPVYPLRLGAGGGSSARFKPDAYKDAITLSYIGGARYGKGFDVFVSAVERLAKDRELLNRVFIICQADVQKNVQPKKDTEAVYRAAARLETAAKAIPRLKVIRGSLSLPDYYSLLLESDAIVLPYRDEVYRVVTSNIFVEAVIAGKIPFVSQNTWMADELSHYGLEKLAFRLDADDIIAVIAPALDRLPEYRAGIKQMQTDYQGFYNARRLVDMITAVRGRQ